MKTLPDKICVGCKRPFTPKSKNQIYCKPKCRIENMKKEKSKIELSEVKTKGVRYGI